MTADSIEATELKAGRELDALVAEKVMGYSWVRWDDKYERWLDAPQERDPGVIAAPQCAGISDFPLERYPHPIPRYSTDIAAAFELLQHFADERYYICLELDADGVWWCQIGAHAPIASKSIPESICLASLAVPEVTPK